MIRHVVLYKFKPETTSPQRQDFTARLRQLAVDIEFIRGLEIGENLTDSPRACDLALIVDLDDEAALVAYNDHPLHQPVRQLVPQLCSASYLADYPA